MLFSWYPIFFLLKNSVAISFSHLSDTFFLCSYILASLSPLSSLSHMSENPWSSVLTKCRDRNLCLEVLSMWMELDNSKLHSRKPWLGCRVSKTTTSVTFDPPPSWVGQNLQKRLSHSSGKRGPRA